ncbi:CBU_0592 family membrane protein [Arthrobacter sp. LFS091]|uniref:CBU_0592 family membrane protein n=1 Tax=Arthrobacter sp. LFS091 TaxID=3229892 RepID=UPI003A80D89F
MELLWEMTGWAGAAAMLGSYLSVSMGWLKPGISFQTANLFGSCAFIINGTLHGAWPSVATNVAWFLISAVALHRLRAAQQPARIEVPEQRSPLTSDTGTHLVIPVPQAAVNCP